MKRLRYAQLKKNGFWNPRYIYRGRMNRRYIQNL